MIRNQYGTNLYCSRITRIDLQQILDTAITLNILEQRFVMAH